MPNPFLQNSFNRTSLDLENNQPNGGPNNFPANGHTQKYKHNSKFVDQPEGIFKGEGKLQSTFNETFLDLEDRVSAFTYFPYTTRIGSETVTVNTVQPFDPHNTYVDSFIGNFPPGIHR
jgi:hypothetical protein